MASLALFLDNCCYALKGNRWGGGAQPLSFDPNLPLPHPNHSSLKHSLCCVLVDFIEDSGQERAFTSQKHKSLHINILEILIHKCNLDNPLPPGIPFFPTRCFLITVLICFLPLFPVLINSAKHVQIDFILFHRETQLRFCSSLLFFLFSIFSHQNGPSRDFPKQRQFPP